VLTPSIAVSPPVMLYMGKDKFESKFNFLRTSLTSPRRRIDKAWSATRRLGSLAVFPLLIYKFHVDNLSSAHVYLRLPSGMTWESIPQEILTDCVQLTKANSIDGTPFHLAYYLLI
jgi:NFACT protein RNA binding domain